jgi:hypothetical protein
MLRAAFRYAQVKRSPCSTLSIGSKPFWQCVNPFGLDGYFNSISLQCGSGRVNPKLHQQYKIAPFRNWRNAYLILSNPAVTAEETALCS